MRKKVDINRIYREMHPGIGKGVDGIPTGCTLNEVRIRPIYSNVDILRVDISSYIGKIHLPLPILGAAMDTVSGSKMAQRLSEMGGCAIIYRTKKPEEQLKMVEEAINHPRCLVPNPMCLRPDEKIEDVKYIMNKHNFKTIPVVDEDKFLKGVVFTKNISFTNHLENKVKTWMVPVSALKTINTGTPFEKIKDRILNEENCSTLPLVDDAGRLHGVYFKKDFFNINPSSHHYKPLVGMAIGVHPSDKERVKAGLNLGIGMIVIDSSHGNAKAVIDQATLIVKLVAGHAVVIAGNVADIDGYYRLAMAGVDGVKCGIGSGSICTTSQATGAGVPMLTLIRELNFMREEMRKVGLPTPAIIADGGINGPGDFVIAMAAGASACMAGKWLVAGEESISAQEKNIKNGMVYYRGMASVAAMKERVTAARYGSKTAAEGIEGWVLFRGPLKSWLPKDIELIKGGFAHAGANNLKKLHAFGNLPYAFVRFTGAGQEQISTRVDN